VNTLYFQIYRTELKASSWNLSVIATDYSFFFEEEKNIPTVETTTIECTNNNGLTPWDTAESFLKN
jgi:hypothetical protein